MKSKYRTPEQITARILELYFDDREFGDGIDKAYKQLWEWIKTDKIDFKLFCHIMHQIEQRSYDGPKL